jgi:hypothetical protein
MSVEIGLRDDRFRVLPLAGTLTSRERSTVPSVHSQEETQNHHSGSLGDSEMSFTQNYGENVNVVLKNL